MQGKLRKINWDALGITASVACAIHCAVLPLFLSSLPLFGVNIIHNLVFEAGMVLLAFCIGVYSLYHGYRRHHHNKWPIALFTVGILLLVFKLFFVHYDTWLLVPAVILIVSAHFMNYKQCRVHNHAHVDDCNH
ncbi:MAG: MerC domain-containing protein [Chitinophagaceae bacterium]